MEKGESNREKVERETVDREAFNSGLLWRPEQQVSPAAQTANDTFSLSHAPLGDKVNPRSKSAMHACQRESHVDP
jgi:hypothetical protein